MKQPIRLGSASDKSSSAHSKSAARPLQSRSSKSINLLKKPQSSLKALLNRLLALLIGVGSVGMMYQIYTHYQTIDTSAVTAEQPSAAVIPVPNYPAVKLSKQSIKNLHMGGFIKKLHCQPTQQCLLGFVKTPDNQVLAVRIGDRLGKEQAQIVEITIAGIRLMQLLDNNTPSYLWIRPHKQST